MPEHTKYYDCLKELERRMLEVHRTFFATLFAQEEAIALELKVLRQEIEQLRADRKPE